MSPPAKDIGMALEEASPRSKSMLIATAAVVDAAAPHVLTARCVFTGFILHPDIYRRRGTPVWMCQSTLRP